MHLVDKGGHLALKFCVQKLNNSAQTFIKG